ncbi:MAG: hypothetical protein LBR11_10950 [Deltaproteobacteria bacterium]|jgi:hypothetical protein|nr:hypothetical protein [Deltaproteobacteria bacterium]
MSAILTRKKISSQSSGTKPRARAHTLKQALARLTLNQAGKLLGPQGLALLKSEAARSVVLEDARILASEEELFELALAGATLSFRLTGPKSTLTASCSSCSSRSKFAALDQPGPPTGCLHLAQALSLLLEEKVALGLLPRPTPVNRRSSSPGELTQRALSERLERAHAEGLLVVSQPPKGVWGDYQVDNPKSARSYRVSLRGWERGRAFCQCPDFRVNGLGACKHTLAVTQFLEKKGHNLKKISPWEPRQLEIYLDYAVAPPAWRILAPLAASTMTLSLLEPWLNRANPAPTAKSLAQALQTLESFGEETLIFPDALERLERALTQLELRSLAAEIRQDPANHPLRQSLLKIPLRPFQLDGIAFAAGAGRAILANDLGLGAIVQGLGLAELLAQKVGLEKVLILCPSGARRLWRDEIRRSSDRSVSLVQEPATNHRALIYGQTFFTIDDFARLRERQEQARLIDWDLLILDESQEPGDPDLYPSVANLNRRFTLALLGPPRPEEARALQNLMTTLEPSLVSQGGLAAPAEIPLAEAQPNLAPLYLRRTREEVKSELPPVSSLPLPVAANPAQLALHNQSLREAQRLLKKPFWSEMEPLQLKKLLLTARQATVSAQMAQADANERSAKLLLYEALITRLLAEKDRKILVVSEWPEALSLAQAPLPTALGTQFRQLDEALGENERQALLAEIKASPGARALLASRGALAGLDLAFFDTVVELEPALSPSQPLKGQNLAQPSFIFTLVTQDTLEERLWESRAASPPWPRQGLAAPDGLEISGPEQAKPDLVPTSSSPAELAALKSDLKYLLRGLPAEDQGWRPDLAPPQSGQERLLLAGQKLKTATQEFFAALAGAPAQGLAEKASADPDPEPWRGFLEKDAQGRTRLVLPLEAADFEERALLALARLFGPWGR